jgi:hypothetical protein
MWQEAIGEHCSLSKLVVGSLQHVRFIAVWCTFGQVAELEPYTCNSWETKTLQ